MAQAKDSTSELIELSQDEAAQVDRLLSLLVDFNLISLPQEPSLAASVTDDPASEELEPVQVAFQPFDAECLGEIAETLIPPQVLESQVEQLSLPLAYGNDSVTLEDSHEHFTQNFSSAKSQDVQDAELIKLLVPWVAELLSHSVLESQEEVVQALTPIIDRVIEQRVTQDRHSVSFALAPAIPSAITQQILTNSEEMATAIAPTMGSAIKKQIELEQDTVIDALYPIIGGTISKYLAETVRAINQQMEASLSVDGIKRKIQAKLQGVSEAELILKEAMPFAVQAIFLIQKMSGLVICDIQRTDSQRLESELIAGMLTAIRSFANDCIAQSGNASELNEIDYGASKIVLEVAGHCYLAIVVQGDPPASFLLNVRQTLSHLIRVQGQAIEQFEGDPDSVPRVVYETLEVLVNPSVEKTSSANKPSPLLWVGLAVFSLVAAPWGFFQHRDRVNHTVETRTATALASVPELAIYRLDARADSGKLTLTGRVPNFALRQKAEQIASAVTPDWSIQNDITAVVMPPDLALTAAEVKRVAATFNRMEGIAISAKHAAGQVSIEGSISQIATAQTMTQAFSQIPGVKSVLNTVRVQPFLLETRFYFSAASATLNAKDFGDKMQRVQSFLDQYPQTHLRIVGYSQFNKNTIADSSLALQRANAVRTELIARGVNPARLQATGLLSLPPGVSSAQPAWLSHCVVLEAIHHNFSFINKGGN